MVQPSNFRVDPGHLLIWYPSNFLGLSDQYFYQPDDLKVSPAWKFSKDLNWSYVSEAARFLWWKYIESIIIHHWLIELAERKEAFAKFLFLMAALEHDPKNKIQWKCLKTANTLSQTQSNQTKNSPPYSNKDQSFFLSFKFHENHQASKIEGNLLYKRTKVIIYKYRLHSAKKTIGSQPGLAIALLINLQKGWRVPKRRKT